MSQVFPSRIAAGCPDCGVPFGHTTACPRTSWLPRVRTAAAINAEACARECREIAACSWPNCACPALVAERAA